jgi:hypothetical protein
MSSATYPQGMKTPNNYLPNGGYKTWKGHGIFRNPTAVTAGNIRPLTNKDYTNTEVYRQGSARPIKHYRRGITTHIPIIAINPNDPNQFIELENNREVKSSKSAWLIGQLIDTPGQFTVRENKEDPCTNCTGIGLVTGYYPQNYLTDNPTALTESRSNCCNAERKALNMVKPASTNLNKNYYTTHAQYMQNRCQTYDQRVFNFYTGPEDVSKAKPGSPLALLNTYVAQCYPNTGPENLLTNRGCKRVVYKPSNYQYAVEGGVSSSARTLKLTLTTVEKNVAMNKKYANNLLKAKVQKCSPPYCVKPDTTTSMKVNQNVHPTVANNGISATFPY